jgi:short-subunit dehydrogenase
MSLKEPSAPEFQTLMTGLLLVESPRWRLPKMTAAAVARAGYDGMNRQSMVVIPGLVTKVLALAGEFRPRRIALEVNRLLWKPRPTRST